MDRKRRRLSDWCIAGDRPCVSACPVDAVDNFGNPYKGCAAYRLKTQAEIDAQCMSADSNDKKGKET